MSPAQYDDQPLLSAVWPVRSNPALRGLALAVLGVIAMTVAAKVKVPYMPVPVTLQTLVLPLLAAAYGPRLGALTALAYLGAGLAGLPVFTNTPPAAPGPLYFLGATGGYLVAYPVAAWTIGWLAGGRQSSLFRLIGAMVAGEAIVLVAGFLWLAFGAQIGGGSGIGASVAFSAGIAPFLLPDLLKIALAACVLRACWALVQPPQT
jgi:biotin transport system substrate-specific component